jgi:hypothetical protein
MNSEASSANLTGQIDRADKNTKESEIFQKATQEECTNECIQQKRILIKENHKDSYVAIRLLMFRFVALVVGTNFIERIEPYSSKQETEE